MCERTSMLVHFRDATIPKARVPHRCVECNGLIAPGTKYYRFAGCYSDDSVERRSWSAKVCPNCYAIWQTLLEASGYEMVMVFGNLGHCIEEAIDAGYIEEDDQAVVSWHAGDMNHVPAIDQSRQHALPF